MVAKSRTNRKKSMKASRSMRGGQPVTTTLAPPAMVYFVKGQFTQTAPPSVCDWKVLGTYKLGDRMQNGGRETLKQNGGANGFLYLAGIRWTDMGMTDQSTTSLFITKKDNAGVDISTGANALPSTIPPATRAQYYTIKLENKSKTSSCVFRVDRITDASSFQSTVPGFQFVFERKNGPNPTLQAPVGTPSFNGELYMLSYALCPPREMPVEAIKYVRA